MNTTSTTTTTDGPDANDYGYEALEKHIRDTIQYRQIGDKWFTTDADPDVMWAAYLNGIPEARRKHYDCRCCRNFIRKHGGLQRLDPTGVSHPVLWVVGLGHKFGVLSAAVSSLYKIASVAKVTGPFLPEDSYLGTTYSHDPKRSVGWTHLSGRLSVDIYKPQRVNGELVNAEQKAAHVRQEYVTLCRGLGEYLPEVIVGAVRLLRSGTLPRSEKALPNAEWLMGINATTSGLKGTRVSNVRWMAAAEAPPGFCSFRSGVLGTLLDDIKEAKSFEVVKRHWTEKVDPLQYQRPTAATSVGAIKVAERQVEEMGLAPALRRKYATPDDVLVKLWYPGMVLASGPHPGEEKGVFGHLLNKPDRRASLTLPPVKVTWEKFKATVLPTAAKLEVYAPFKGPYYGLLTAAVPDAPPLLQWDGLAGHPRNPVSWYFYHGGSSSMTWNLSSGVYHPVEFVFDSPAKWQDPDRFRHQADTAFFSLKPARDSQKCGSGLFPEILRGDIHGVRKVIKAHSNKTNPEPEAGQQANGIAFQGGDGLSHELSLCVTDTTGSVSQYILDRWN